MTLKVRKAETGDFTDIINSNICCFNENILKERNQKRFVHFEIKPSSVEMLRV